MEKARSFMRTKIFFILILILAILLSAFGGIKLAQYIDGREGGNIQQTDSQKVENTTKLPSTENNESHATEDNDNSSKDVLETHDTTENPDEPENKTIRITAVGDIMLGRGVGSRLEKQGKGYVYAFEKVADILKEGDIVFGNLEGPISDKTHSLTALSKENKGGKYVLKNKIAAFEAIKYAGFNMLSLANNHILDYYDKALFDTFEILDQNGIAYSGAGRNLEEAREAAIVEKNGIKIGLLSYTDMAEYVYSGNPSISFIAGENKAGVAPRKLEYIRQDIGKVRGNVDILIISLHWGIEESFEVSSEQVEFAHELIDTGADVILGHHPHQFQGIEIYKGKPIIYSLGNFIFDQNDPENQEAFIVNLDYKNNKLVDMTAIPVRTIEKTQVVPLTRVDAEALLRREIELSSNLNTRCSIDGYRLVFELK
jgi:poly-gamma-glutamate capsule biosynthesis protein CapA/YwtB (metallophosphatase superfamily)